MSLGLRKSVLSPLMSAAANIVMLYVVYTLCRVEFLLENHDFFSETVGSGRLLTILKGGAALDTPGIFYLNAIYVLMMLLPWHKKENPSYYKACRWYFIIVNTAGVVANVADSVYFPYTMRRTTADVFSEFSNETNLWSIFGIETLRHWYLLLFVVLIVWGMWKLYVSPAMDIKRQRLPRYYVLSVLSVVVAGVTTVSAIRGGFLNHWWNYPVAAIFLYIAWRLRGRRLKAGAAICAAAGIILLVLAPIGGWRHRDIRPLALSSASAYTSRPMETALVLNTPFSIIRSIGKTPFKDPGYFTGQAELDAVYMPVHSPQTSGVSASGKGKNVVVIIIESFGADYIGYLNRGKEGFRSYTPFTDSLAAHSATWEYALSNGRKSIDAMPSILASIPMFVKPFVLTPKALNHIEGLPYHLAREGYATAFFHGARTGSMGFDAFASNIGFSQYYGREDFNRDPRFNGDEDFDGYWAIWDEPFMQYFALKLSDMKQPFFATLFTASSHHPFHIPEKYKDKYPEGNLPIQKCIEYTDQALREFFATARKQPWYANTLFVITADHSNESEHAEYRSDIGGFRIPILFYDPGNPGLSAQGGLAQQIDIMPSILDYLGYSRPYLAFGNSLFAPEREEGGEWAVNYLNGIYQYVAEGHVLQFDGEKPIGLYALTDPLMRTNLIGREEKRPLTEKMTNHLKGIIQSYMQRMAEDRLSADSK